MTQGSLTLYIEGNSRLHDTHPFNKLAYVLLTGVVVYCAPGGWMPDAAIFGLNLLLGIVSGTFPKLWQLTWRMLLPLALFMLPIHGFLYPGNETALVTMQGVSLYREGLEFAFTVLLQLAAILTASLLFVLTTHPANFITSLTQAGWPPFFAYLMGGPLLMLPAMRERIRTIQAAQRSRGLDSDGSILKRIYSIAPLVTPLVLGAFMEIEQRALALELRGFGLPGRKTSLRVVGDSNSQRAFRWVMVLISLATLSADILFLR